MAFSLDLSLLSWHIMSISVKSLPIRSRCFWLCLCSFLLSQITAPGVNAQSNVILKDAPARPIRTAASVRMILVDLNEICPPLFPNRPRPPCAPVTPQDVKELARTHKTSAPYNLTPGELAVLKLEPDFQRALVFDIIAGSYAILLEFDWGDQIIAVVDVKRRADIHLPNWSSLEGHHFYKNDHCYSLHNASDFDPGANERWEVRFNGVAFYRFYVAGGG